MDRRENWKDKFIEAIKSESASRAEVYKAKPGAWFASNAHLGKAVIDGLALSTLAKAKYELWLRDETLTLRDMGFYWSNKLPSYHGFQRSYAKLLALQRQELTEAEEAAARQVEGSDGRAAIMVAGVIGKNADTLNGWYETTGDLQNGKPLFRKLKTPDAWLRFTRDKKWMFSDTSDKDLNNNHGWCVSVEAGKDLPTEVDRWNIDNTWSWAVREDEESESDFEEEYSEQEGEEEEDVKVSESKEEYEQEGEEEDEDEVNDQDSDVTWARLKCIDVYVAKQLQAQDSGVYVAKQLQAQDSGVKWKEHAQMKCIDAVKQLQALALNDCVSRRLLAGEDELDLPDETTGLTPLVQHLSLGDFKVAERLLQARASPEHGPSQDEEGKTPLLWASKEGYVDAALLLLKYKANIESTDKNLRTPLDLAVENEKEEVAAVLRAHGARHSLRGAAQKGMEDEVAARIAAGQDVNARDEYGRTALHLAAKYGYGGIVEALLKAGCNADVQDTEDDRTALHLAAAGGHGGIAEALLKAGCNADIQDRSGTSAVELAQSVDKSLHYRWSEGNDGMGGLSELLKVLCKYGARGALCYAAKNNLRDMVTELIFKVNDLDECDKEYLVDGWTALHYAASEGHTDIAEVLLQAGCNPQIQNEDGWTALHYAAYKGHGSIAEAVLKAGCNADIQEKVGWTALHYAASEGHGDIAEALLKAGCNSDIQTKGGNLALELAARAKHGKMVGVLIAAGMAAGQDVNACLDSVGKTMLMCASQGGHEESVGALIEKGASLETVDKDGRSALHYAAAEGHGGIVEALLKAGCNPQIQDKDGSTALHLVAKNGYVGIAEALLQAGCNPQIEDKGGNLAMELAARAKHGKMVGVLIAAGLDVNQINFFLM